MPCRSPIRFATASPRTRARARERSASASHCSASSTPSTRRRLTRPELAERLGLDPLGRTPLLHDARHAADTWRSDGGAASGTGPGDRAPARARLAESIATFVGCPVDDLHWQVLDLLPDAARAPAAVLPPPRCRGARGECDTLGGVHDPGPVLRDLAAARMHRERRRAGARSRPAPCGARPPGRAAQPGLARWRACATSRRTSPAAPSAGGARPAAKRVRSAAGSSRSTATRRGISFREGDVFELGLGDADSRDVVSVFNLAHHLPEAAQPRARAGWPRAALQPGGLHGDRRLGAAGAGRAGLRARRDLEPAVLRAGADSRNFTPSEIRGWMEAAGFERGRGAPATSARRGAWWWSAGDPAHGRHRHGRLRAAPAPHRRRPAGARARPRPAPPGRPARARADRARRPLRPALVPQRPARRGRPWCTWRPRSATSRAASIEELNALATLRLVRAAERAGRASASCSSRR